MASPYERMKSAWELPDGRLALHRVVEVMAAEGATRDELDHALAHLLDDVRAAGADEAAEEVICSVGDRLHGWCHASRHIQTQDAGATSSRVPVSVNGTNSTGVHADQPATT